MNKEQTNTALIILTTTIAIILVLSLAIYLISKADYEENPEGVYVSEVIDGDTIRMSTGETIRLLCVDTPESGEAGYEEATEFLEDLVLLERVRLEPGVLSNDTDRYERYLRYVYVNSSGEEILVNREIIIEGLGDLFEYGEDCGRI